MKPSSTVVHPQIPKYFVIIFIVLLVVIALAAYFYYGYEKNDVLRDKENDLITIADLKTKQILHWRQERLSDANFIFSNIEIIHEAISIVKQGSPLILKQQAPVWMNAMFKNGHYERMMIISTTDGFSLALPALNNHISPYLRSFIDSVAISKVVMFSDLHLGENSKPELDIVVPIVEQSDTLSRVIAVVVLEVDPAAFLYPLIQSWPTSSRTSETLLLIREGNDVLFLNELRHQKNTALALKFPIAKKTLPAAWAAQGHEGIIQGSDYRDIPVLAATRRIPQSPWFLVAKTDKDEIYDDFYTETRLILISSFLFALFSGALLLSFLRHQRGSFYRALYEKETEKLALARHYEHLTKHANDIIILFDEQDRIIEVNERACESYQYSKDEFLKLSLRDLRPPETVSDIEIQKEKVEQQNGYVYETFHRRKDGSVFPVEKSARIIKINERSFYQTMIRDITERKKTETRIQRLNRMYATLSQINQTIVRSKTQEELLRNICHVSFKYGKFTATWIGLIDKGSATITPICSCGIDIKEIQLLITNHGIHLNANTPWETAVREQDSVVCNDIFKDSPLKDLAAHARSIGFRSFAVIPLSLHNSVIALFNVYTKEDNFFDAEEVDLLEEIKMDICYALEALEQASEHKKTEEALRESEEKYQFITETIPGVLYNYKMQPDGKSRLSFVGPQCRDIFELEPDELLQDITLFWEMVHREDIKELREAERIAISTVGEYEEEARIVTKSGKEKWIHIGAKPTKHSPNELPIWSGFAYEITDKKRAEEELRVSEERYRGLFEHMTEGYAYCKMIFENNMAQDWIYLAVNDAFTDLTGLKEVTGKRVTEVIPGIREADPELFKIYSSVSLTGKPEKFEIYVEALKMWFSVSAYCPERGYFVSVFDVITERKQAEEKLRASEERYRGLVESQNELVVRVDPQGHFTYVNDAYCKKYGLTREDLLGKASYKSLVHPDDLPGTLEAKKGLEHPPYRITVEQRTFAVEGVRWVEWEDYAIHDHDGNIIEIQGVGRDIHERKMAEQALKASEERYRSVVNNVKEVIFQTNAEGIWTFLNPVWTEITGFSVEESLGTLFLNYVHPDDRQRNLELFQPLIQRKEDFCHHEIRYITKDGGIRWIEVFARLTLSETDETLGTSGTLTDITERRRSQEEVQRLRKAVETSGEIIFMTDKQGTITYVNPAFTSLYGYSPDEIIGKTTPRILKSGKQSPDEYDQFWRRLLNKKIAAREFINKGKDGIFHNVEVSVNPIFDDKNEITGFLALQRDVTEKKQLEEQYYRAQRLESLGTLAGGIAHDLNNVLTPVLLATELFKQKFTDKLSQSIIETVEKSALRGKGIVQQILTFARGSQGERGVLQLKHIVREMEKIVQETFPKTIQFKSNIENNLFPVSGDATQLHQVLLNLCVNARDAMPLGGTITITGENHQVDHHITMRYPDVKPGVFALLKVRDSGEGIAPDVLQKIFEPFFTTKERGKGTGLGLTIVHSIIKSHGGFMTVESEIGKGAQFSIYLPAIEHSQLSLAELHEKDLPGGHGEHILVVDDETSVRDITKQILEMFGYTVSQASDGTEAIALYVNTKIKVDAVLTDIMMPVMDGYATIRALKKINPGLIIIAASGLTSDLDIIKSTGGKIEAFLQKPFSPKSLLETLNEALRQGKTAGQ